MKKTKKNNESAWAIAFWLQIAARKIQNPQGEYRFHPMRRWRFDFAWPEIFLAVEVDGGISGVGISGVGIGGVGISGVGIGGVGISGVFGQEYFLDQDGQWFSRIVPKEPTRRERNEQIRDINWQR